MGLEKVIEENPIVQGIGKKIEDPFKPLDTTTRYLITVRHLVRIHKGQETLDEMVDAIISNHLPSVTNRDGFLKYVNNEHRLVNGFLYILFMEYGKEALQIEDIYRFIGRSTINPMFLQIAAGESLGLNFIYSQVARLTPNFTTVKEITYDSDQSKKGLAVIRSRTIDDYRKRVLETFGEDLSPIVLRNDCLLTQGVLEGGPKVVNFDNDFARVVEEPYCEVRGDDFCEYHLEWDVKPYLATSEVSLRSPRSIANAVYYIGKGLSRAITTKIINNLPAVRKYIDTILEMEVIIQQNAEEIQRQSEARSETEKSAAVRETELKLEQSFSGGLAHEGRNALQPAALQMRTLEKYKDGKDVTKVLIESGNELDGIIGKIGEQILALETDYGVPKDVIYKQMLPLLQEVDARSKEMSAASERIGNAIPIINNSIGRGLALAQQFLEYSKLQEVRRGSTKINLSDVISGVTNTYSNTFQELGIEYVTHIHDPEAFLLGDYLQLESVLKNLILNAKDAVIKKEEKKIEVSLARHDKTESPYFQLIVEDNGEGISKENQAKIFGPFFSTKPTSGTGLGLNFVKRIIDAYNGTINIESKKGEGTKFYINLPINQ